MIIVKERLNTLDIPTLFSWFIIYSSIGWIYETTYCYLTTGKILNRGFLYGPYCPIYGLSILFMILLLTDRCKNIVTLFLSCALVATVLEYISSYWMEMVFNRRWWNYSNMMFNINGRVCLGASILFGICGVLFVRYIHPAMIRYIRNNIPELQLRIANKIILVLFVIDVLFSFRMSLI
ncbi:putative ABC transporter permease [Mobilitalea sibirica]|uniref:Putative ABC transporter permease n=1 Tax=Mobilitalea sibirica TaxID=1462919 RepID=A0A8J7KZ95_9FIRM|nr:putative ABC transporter permease [Mobilitalea sibirica]MBH1939708.1 putative ABC transporter permease [Mobilitalea sibirica]